MKVLCVVVVAFLGLVSSDPLEDFITSALISLKKEMPAGIPDIDIPPMDPLRLPEIQEELKTELGDVSVVFEVASASNLSDFDVRFVSAVGDRLELFLAFPIIPIAGEYVLTGTILGLPFRGRGDASLAVLDVFASVSATLKTDADNVTTATGFRTKLTEGSTFLALEKFDLSNSISRGIIARIAEALFRKYQPNLEASLNDALSKGIGAALTLRHVVPMAKLPAPHGVYEAGNANEFLDHMLEQARPSLVEQDPVPLPDARLGFEQKIIGVTVHGEVKIFNGFLAGIQTLHRTGDAEMTQSADMTKIKISAHLGLVNLHGAYSFHAKFMNIGPNGQVSIKVSLVSVEIHVSIDMSSGKPKPKLDFFDISHVGKIEVYFDGLGPLDWIINSLGQWVVNLVKQKIVDMVEGPLHKILADKLENSDIPFPG